MPDDNPQSGLHSGSPGGSEERSTLSLTAIPGIGEIDSGDALGRIIADATDRAAYLPMDNDILVISQKVVSKAEGRLVKLADVAVSTEARNIAAEAEKDPALVQLILNESQQLLRVRPGLIIVRHRLGMVLANAGIDQSNTGAPTDASVLLLPEDPDRSAVEIFATLTERYTARIAVLIIDSVGRAWRQGVVGLTIGVAGLAPLVDLIGTPDRDGRKLAVTEVAIADQIAAAASLLMGEADEGRPVVWLRGLAWQTGKVGADALIRPVERDLFL